MKPNTDSVSLKKLWDNLRGQIQEVQVKLGYAPETLRFYYPWDSLGRLLGVSCQNAEEMAEMLREMTREAAGDFRKPEDTYLAQMGLAFHGSTVEITLPPQAATYVHENDPPSPFLTALIGFFASHHHAKIKEIQALFSTYGKPCIQRMPEGSDFDYALWFPEGVPDDFVYCIRSEMGHTIYHRFTRGDYEAL